jgi:hypothetical protein
LPRLPEWFPEDLKTYLNIEPDLSFKLGSLVLKSQGTGIHSGSGLFKRGDDFVHEGTIGTIVNDKNTDQLSSPLAMSLPMKKTTWSQH